MMANVNQLNLVGRLTRDPETKTIGAGTVCNFGFAVNNRKKNPNTGQTEDVPMYIECVAWNARGDSAFKLADFIKQYMRKGSQVYLSGSLDFETWQDKTTGQNRSKHKFLVRDVQLLDRKDDSQGGGGGYSGGNRNNTNNTNNANNAGQGGGNANNAGGNQGGGYGGDEGGDYTGDDAGGNGDIPF